MQSPDHLERKWPSAIELVHAVSAADEGNQIARLKPVLVHVIFDRLHRVGGDRADNAFAPKLPPT